MSLPQAITRPAVWLLTQDFVPGTNRYVYWLKTPLGVLVAGAIAATLCGLFVAKQGLVVALALVWCLALGIVWPWLGLRGITCELRFAQQRGREGEPLAVQATLINRWPWPVWGLCLEQGFALADGETTALALARLGGWSRSEFDWDFTPAARGVFPRTTPVISTGFPFGLWQAQRPVRVCQQIIVWPELTPLVELPLPAGELAWAAAPSTLRAGDEGDRQGARPYRAGDSLRNLHWSLTARLDRWIVSERQGSAQARARVQVDVSPQRHTAGPDGTLEWAIRIAASIAVRLAQQGAVVQCDLVREGEVVESLELRADAASLRRFLDLLASFDAGERKPLNVARRRLRRRTAASRTGAVHAPLEFQIGGNGAGGMAARASHRPRLIRLDTSSGNGAGTAPSSDAWIEIDDLHRAAQQLADGWRRRSAEVWRGR